MTQYTFIADFFQQHFEHASLAMDNVADFVEDAAHQISTALLNERKVLVVAAGLDAPAAQLFSELMTNGALRERPPLPSYPVIYPELNGQTVHALNQKLSAYGQSGDVALLFASQLRQTEVDTLQQQLQDRGVQGLWLGALSLGYALPFSGTPPLHKLPICYLTAQCIASLVDISLFGPMEE